MLVKVNDKYAGMYGVYNEDTRSVTTKTRESAPFEEDDALSLRMIKKGVLVKADEKPIEEPEEEEEDTKAEEPEEEEAAEEEDALPFLEGEETGENVYIQSLKSMSIKELREVGKEHGVSYKVGMSKEQLINDITKAVDETPIMTAAEPE